MSYVAQTEGRQWVAFEERIDYLAASAFRFLSKDSNTAQMKDIHTRISQGDSVDLNEYQEGRYFSDSPIQMTNQTQKSLSF